MDDPNVLRGYAADAEELISRFEALASEDVLAPVLDLLPETPCRILDVGAGTGRDAAWLAGKGHQVVAAEPVDELRRAGMALHPHPHLSWVDDRLPSVPELLGRGESYDLILIVAVWQHLRPELQRPAVSNLARLLAPGGRLILSLRHGPGAPARPCYPPSPQQLIETAAGEGLRLLERRESSSVQQKNRERGVTWTWLSLAAPL